MKYVYCGANPKRYATDLHFDSVSGTLQWACGRGQDTLLVQTPYGQEAVKLIETICTELSSIHLQPDHFTELKQQSCPVAVRMVSAMEKVRANGCAPCGTGRTYTVFACVSENNTCQVFYSRRQTVSSPECDLPMYLRVEISTVTQNKGFLRKSEILTGYYRLSFPESCDESYVDGDLEYQADGFHVPITRRMFKAGEAYVRCGARPELIPRKTGLQLV